MFAHNYEKHFLYPVVNWFSKHLCSNHLCLSMSMLANPCRLHLVLNMQSHSHKYIASY